MKKWWYFLPILIGVFFVLGCTEKPILSDIQVAACNSAHDNNNCDKLGDLGLVTKSDCCSALSKCCTNLLTGNVVSSISSSLSDVQVVACESAASVDSCDKLVNLGIVTEDECCSELGLCCTWVPVEEFKEVLIQAIKDYFSDTSVLTVDELKDLIVVYFSTSGDYVDLSGVGQYSGENLLDIYEKAKAASPGLSIKLWVEGNPSSVPYNSEFNVMWSAPGAVSCAGYGHHVPAVGGGLWTESPNLSAEGSKRLYARHANYGYITPLELGLSCFDGKSNNAFNKEIFVNVDPPSVDERYCQQNSDCACGKHKVTGECFYGNKAYVNTFAQCPDFCTGIGGNSVIKCISNQCTQVSGTGTCMDSDGGLNYYVKGTASVSSVTKTDECAYCTGLCSVGSTCSPTCGAVKEYYCSGNAIADKTFVCPSGYTCREGACSKLNK